MPLGVGQRQGPMLSDGVDTPLLSRLTHIATQDVTLHVMSKMRTALIALDQRHGAKYSRSSLKLGLVVHGHNRGDESWRYKHTLAHCQQMEELTITEIQLGVSEVVLCRRASNRDLVHVSPTWVFWICCCPESCRSQILTLMVLVYSTVCTFKTRRVWCVWSNFGYGNWL